MKKFACFIFVFLSLCSLGGCKTSKPIEPVEPTQPPKNYYEFQGVRVGSPWQDALEILGDYEDRLETDTVFTDYVFPQYMVVTYKQDDEEFVHTIRLRSDGVTTEEGAMVGDTKDAVVEKQGADYTTDEFGNIIYVKKTTVLKFFIDEDGFVFSIEYYENSEE